MQSQSFFFFFFFFFFFKNKIGLFPRHIPGWMLRLRVFIFLFGIEFRFTAVCLFWEDAGGLTRQRAFIIGAQGSRGVLGCETPRFLSPPPPPLQVLSDCATLQQKKKKIKITAAHTQTHTYAGHLLLGGRNVIFPREEIETAMRLLSQFCNCIS